jgi:hypothetical protein
MLQTVIGRFAKDLCFGIYSVYRSSGVIRDVAHALVIFNRGRSNSPSIEIVICDSYPVDVLIDKLVAELSFRIILSQ